MKSNYSAKIIAHSISPSGIELLTFEIEYPRFIHSELMTHRMLPKNAASSRAIPIETMHKHIMDNTAQPIYWGKNQKGMSASEEINDIPGAIKIWMRARDYAIACARRLAKKEVHKQTANRLVEPYVVMKTIISGTCWENFYHLRDHKDAQPEFRYLAKLMKAARDASSPIILKHGEWHLPYVESVRNEFGKLIYLDLEGKELSLENARIISAACCAQVSYRKLNESVGLCKSIYTKMIESTPAHCFIEGTKVLTKSGFKDFSEVTKDDLIADIHRESLEFMGWKLPNSIIARHIEAQEKVYYYENIGLGVTGDHTMIGSLVNKSSQRSSLDNLQIYKPSDTPSSNKGTKKTLGERECNLPTACCKYVVKNQTDELIGKLIGFYIGDGFSSYNTAHFRLVKDRKINYISDILNKLDIRFIITKNKGDLTSVGNQVSEITFKFEQFNLAEECGIKSNNKKIPLFCYNNLDMLAGVFDGLKNSDGSELPNNRWVYSTTSSTLRDQIIFLGPIIGVVGKIGTPMISSARNICYRIQIKSKMYHKINDTRKEGSKVKILDNYAHKVYCVSMDSGGIIVQTPNNEVLVSGNCSPVEHQATPIDLQSSKTMDGITHMTKDGMLWSGPFKGWVQFRKLIPNESVW